ncbi:MAG: MBL fold metallo-hydrolase [Candidatus Hydrogenedentes bacterium]|nr:MBL fold metallo-hydrolase [Candidatus Hydrogenedentota bacterium]
MERPRITRIPLPSSLPMGGVNVFLYRGREALTLFDTGVLTEDAYAALEAGLAAEGVAVRDLERIVLTHHHFDHIGLLRRLAEASGAQTCGHPDTLECLRMTYQFDGAYREYYRALFREMGVPGGEIELFIAGRERLRQYLDVYSVDRFLADGSVLDGFTVHHVPGHSPTDTLFLHASGDAVVGDHLLATVTPNPILRRPFAGRERVKTLVEYRESLMKTRSLPISWCHPGHGGGFGDAPVVADAILARQDRCCDRIMALLPEEGMTPFEALRALYPSPSAALMFFRLSVAAGHLEWLETLGQVRREQETGGASRYYPAAPAAKETP